MHLNVTSGLVVNDDGQTLNGYSAIQTEDESCHLRLEEVAEEDLGSWTCVLGLDQTTRTFRWAGTQALLTGEQVSESEQLVTSYCFQGYVKDVRLPGNLIPRVYNISVLPVLEPGNFTTRFDLVSSQSWNSRHLQWTC